MERYKGRPKEEYADPKCKHEDMCGWGEIPGACVAIKATLITDGR